MSETVVKDESTVIDAEVVEVKHELAPAPAAPLAQGSTKVSLATLSDMGFIVPIAQPEELREAFATLQRMYAAVLDPNDYLYTVSYTDRSHGKSRNKQQVFSKREDAEKFAQPYGASVSAKPMKSGIVKLARALGISARRKLVKGLPEDPNATYSYVVYEAEHLQTGSKEEGVGWCDKGERGGYISTHDVIATADTRAYNRAVLRLSGFGDVSADEIVGTTSDEVAPARPAPEAPKHKPSKPLPEATADEVQAACRVWAERIVEREGNRYAPEAQQDTRNARELRARARRGDQTAAKKLGGSGLRWTGVASDGMGYQPFPVEEPPITPESIALVKAVSSPNAEPPPKANGASKSLDLTGNGGDPDKGLPADLHEHPGVGGGSGEVPAPSPKAEPITTKQAKKITALLKEVFGTREEMIAWLEAECHVNSTTKIRANQYEPAMKALKSKKGD